MSTSTAEVIQAGSAPAEAAPAEAAPAEAELRVQLAAAYRLVEHFGWNESIYGHLTVRVPGPERHFLINPYGLRYGEVTASNLVKITLEGAIVGTTAWSVNVAGYAIHGAIHAHAADAHCVMHTHSPAGMAVAALQCGLLPISLDATLFHGTVGYHDYEGAVVSDAEKARLVRDLGDNRALILRNHGLVTVGRTIAEAFLYLHRLETACKTQVDALAMNSALSLVPEEVCAKSAREIDAFSRHVNDIGALEFAAYMRMLDQTDAGYRE
jgi:ribulose-5-phosphate 4-epimerase/fuculose-1-phosphate aldolase